MTQREVEGTLHWGKLTPEQTHKLYEARRLLSEVGVTFDSDVTADGSICCWEFDWSLKGPVKVIFKRFVDAKSEQNKPRKELSS